MSTTTPTPEEFMLLAVEPDEDLEPEQEPDRTPLERLADVEHRLARVEQRAFALETGGEFRPTPDVIPVEPVLVDVAHLSTREDWLDEHLADLEEKHRVVLQLVEEIGGIVKKSTSKVSLDVKAAIERWANPLGTETPSPAPSDVASPEPAVDDAVATGSPDVQQRAGEGSPGIGPWAPSPDDSVEVWRDFAHQFGQFAGQPIDTMNRSQIRTLLGIEQPVDA